MRTRWCMLAALLLCVVGCNRPTSQQFELVRPGMTQDEVRSLLGAPSSQRTVASDDQALVGYAERWQYGDTLSSLATDALFPDAPDDRVYALFFDAEGRLIEARRPVSLPSGSAGVAGGGGGGGGLIGGSDPWGSPQPGGSNAGMDWSR